jgi:hypothetical protein
MPIKIVGRESTIIPEGKHPARISALKVEKRGKEKALNGDCCSSASSYEYLDVHVEIQDVETKEGKHPSIKYGCPFDLTPNTKLGKLLKAFGVSDSQIASGESLDIEKVLTVGKSVQILTKDVETDKMDSLSASLCREEPLLRLYL